MSDDQSSRSQGSKSWLERISQAFSSGPESVEDVLEILRDAESQNIIDTDSMSIIEGAMQVIDMRVPEIIASAHSRFPVLGESPDDVLGVLLAKDLLPLALNNDLNWSRIREIMRPATFVPESKRLNQLLKEFKENRNHMAIVVDEYGGTAGLITIEDVLEQIVGEIEDEHDFDEETHIKARGDGTFAVKAVTPVDDFNEFFGTGLDEEEFDTIGGLVLKEFGHLPRRGETVEFGGLQFTIANADNRVIRLLQVTRSES